MTGSGARRDVAIELRGLGKRYGDVRALEDVSFSVGRGEVFGFLGPNGAGKSTAIRILFDLIRPSQGSASVLGLDCQAQSVRARQKMGYLAGELSLYEGLTGQQNIDLFRSLRRGVDEGFVEELTSRLNLDTGRVTGEYSKGNRQKLGLVLSMMHRPEVLVLDEPTSGLDPLIQDQVNQLLREFAAQGCTVFFSSHILSEVESMCDRVAILRGGRLVAVEDVAALKGRSLHVLDVTFDAPVAAAGFDIPGVTVREAQARRLVLEVRDNLDQTLKAIAQHTVVDLRTEQPSLDEVFRVYYEGEREPRAARTRA